MDNEKDFKTVTVTFNRANKDIKDILIKFTELTGKSKVDVIADALRQYNPNKTETINKNDIKQMIKEVLSEEGFVKNTEEQNEEDTINKLAEKKISQKFLEDDD